jgi:hypothetical protein
VCTTRLATVIVDVSGRDSGAASWATSCLSPAEGSPVPMLRNCLMPASAGEVPDRAAEDLALEPDDDPNAALWAALTAAPAEGNLRSRTRCRIRHEPAMGLLPATRTRRSWAGCTDRAPGMRVHNRDQRYQETPRAAHIGSITVVCAYD